INRLVSFPEKFTYNASIIYPTEIIKAAQPSLAKAKFFKKGWWLRWKNWKRNFKKPNGLNRGNVL
ncbi:unnamed protein product, partial [Brassica oleracea var. botrytis]